MKSGDGIIYFDREGKAHDALAESPAADASGRVDLLYVDDNKRGFLGGPDFHLALIRESGVQKSEEVESKCHCYADPRQVPAESAKEEAVPESEAKPSSELVQ